MKLLYETPCLCLLVSFMVAVLLAGKGFPFLLSSLIAGFIMLALGFCSYDGTPHAFYVLVLCFVVGLLGSSFLAYRVGNELILADRISEKAVVAFERPWGSKRAVVFKTAKGKYVADVSPSLALREGDSVEIKASILPLENKSTGFNPYTYWRSRGVRGRLVGLQTTKSRKAYSFSLYRWRSFLRRWVLLNFPPRVRGYLLTLLFGVKDPDLAQLHSKWGTSHLLAVSGFHVALVVGIVFRALKKAKWKVQISLLLLFFYLAFTGFAASAMRAGLMTAFVLIGKMIGRPIRTLQAVSLAAVCLLLWRPWFVWDVGWKLSVMSALTIGCTGIFSKRISLLTSSALLWMVTAGIVLTIFGSLPVVGLFSNLIAIPVFALLFFVVLLSTPLVILPFGLGTLVVWFAEKALLVFEWLLNFLASFMPMSITEPWHWPIISIAILFVILTKRLNFGFFRSICVSSCGLVVYMILLS